MDAADCTRARDQAEAVDDPLGERIGDDGGVDPGEGLADEGAQDLLRDPCGQGIERDDSSRDETLSRGGLLGDDLELGIREAEAPVVADPAAREDPSPRLDRPCEVRLIEPYGAPPPRSVLEKGAHLGASTPPPPEIDPHDPGGDRRNGICLKGRERAHIGPIDVPTRQMQEEIQDGANAQLLEEGGPPRACSAEEPDLYRSGILHRQASCSNRPGRVDFTYCVRCGSGP